MCVFKCVCFSEPVLSWRVGVGVCEIFACSLPKKGLKISSKRLNYSSWLKIRTKWIKFARQVEKSLLF